MKHTRYFFKAKNAALNSRHKFMVGACLVIGKSLYLGWNKAYKTDPNSKSEFPTVHAELDAIKKAGINRDMSNAKLYIFRQMRNGNVGLARPCIDCYRLIKGTGIKEFYYSIDNNSFGSYNHNSVWGEE